jgi:lipopolysaccharide export system protein LptA
MRLRKWVAGASVGLWLALLSGCAAFQSTAPEGPDVEGRAADTLVADTAAESSEIDPPDSLALQDSASVEGGDTLVPAPALPDTAGDSRPSNDSLRRLTPQDTIPSGEQQSRAESDRVRVRADSLSARESDEGDRLQELFGNVFVRQDSTRLRSQEAVRYLESDEFLFRGNVVIYERGDTLRAATVRYDRPSKVGRAFGRVHLSDGDVDVYSSRAIYYADEKRSVFPDSVLLVDDDKTLRAESGVYLSDAQRADFFGNVRVRDPETYMEADTVVYYRNEKRTEARGNVFIDRNPSADDAAERDVGYDSLEIRARNDGRMAPEPGDEPSADRANPADAGEQTLLWGDEARNDEERKTSRVTGRALLLQVRTDSAGSPTDTLLVRSHRLNAQRSDTLRRMVAIDSVRIWQPDLSAVADSVVYDRFLNGTDDDVPSLEETRLYRAPLAWFDGSQVSGDTIRVVVRNRSVDTVYVRSNAFAAQEDSVSGRIQQLKGRLITAVFRHDSLRQIIARPNARAIRFMTGRDGSENGAARTSADRIVLRFVDEQVERVSVLGGTETTYYKQAIVPDPFRLDGFMWVPDRRPTRRMFLDDDRVRRRLEPDTERSPTDPASPRTDSLAAGAGSTETPGTGRRTPSGDGSRAGRSDSSDETVDAPRRERPRSRRPDSTPKPPLR